MPTSEESLRAALRDFADQAGPARFTAGHVIRGARRRRARFTTIAGCCALAVAAAAIAVPPALAGPGPRSYVPPTSSGAAANGRWPASFGCDQRLPSALPGPAGYELRISVGPVTRTASGQPHVTWYLAGTGEPGNTGPSFGRTQALVLVVRDDGSIVAVLPAPPTPSRVNIPLGLKVVPNAEVERTQPEFAACQPPDWARVWADHEHYGVVVLMTAWVGYPGANPARFSAAAALGPG